MKYSKVAAVVAGSMMAVGVAAPAFADGMTAPEMPTAATMPTSINGGVEQALNEQPLQQLSDGLKVDSALRTVSAAADRLRGETSTDALLGQATSATKDAATSTVTGAVPGASLLGGLPLGR
ncbi:hypothetical protein ACIOC1_01575 [Streptomyces sp. NPDC088197]|uniref:hypothetical protein n=1 Tax=unclassified Streptomyces TaxID=2593676 RepID=UPI0033A03C8E